MFCSKMVCKPKQIVTKRDHINMTYIKDGLDVSNISFDFSRSVKWYILLTESQIFHTLTVKFGLYLC